MIGHQHVQPAKCGHRRGHEGMAVGGGAQVLLDGHAMLRTAAFGRQRLSLAPRLAIIERHPRPRPYKQLYRSRANPPRPACDERDLVFK